MIMFDITVVLVTYNRKSCLETLLNALEKQTYPIARVIIFDNNSSDGTPQRLEELGYIQAVDEISYNQLVSRNCEKFELFYYRNDKNIGGSGGFSNVIKLALKIHSDYIWIMDDDVKPEPECLETLLSYMSNDVRACIPNRTDEFYQDRACIHFDMVSPIKGGLMARKKYADLPLKEDCYKVEDMPFEGPLVSFDLIKQIGLPDPDYFILCDDSDYAQRILELSPILFVTKAVLHRQLAKNIAKGTNNKSMNWRDYYGIRNTFYFMKKYGKNWLARCFSPLVMVLRYFVISIIKKRWTNLKILKRAMFDGYKNVRGATVKPGDL